jgi:hypothetical protein
VNCPHCGRHLDLVEGQNFCTFCGGDLEHPDGTEEESPFDKPAITGPYDSEPSGPRSSRPDAYCPWEDQEELGFVKGIVETLRGSLFHPNDFFATIPIAGGLLQPLLFALIVGTLGTMMGLVWGAAIDPSLLSGPKAIAVAFVPVLIFFSIVLWALILHGSLFLVGGAKEDFEATFRVICYTSGTELFNAIPFLGGFIVIGWKLYITVIALKQVHRVGIGRAVLAISLPLILCLVFAIVVLVIAFFVLRTVGG